MKSDNKLSSILHVILHLAEHNQTMTSETLALYLNALEKHIHQHGFPTPDATP